MFSPTWYSHGNRILVSYFRNKWWLSCFLLLSKHVYYWWWIIIVYFTKSAKTTNQSCSIIRNVHHCVHLLSEWMHQVRSCRHPVPDRRQNSGDEGSGRGRRPAGDVHRCGHRRSPVPRTVFSATYLLPGDQEEPLQLHWGCAAGTHYSSRNLLQVFVIHVLWLCSGCEHQWTFYRYWNKIFTYITLTSFWFSPQLWKVVKKRQNLTPVKAKEVQRSVFFLMTSRGRLQ